MLRITKTGASQWMLRPENGALPQDGGKGVRMKKITVLMVGIGGYAQLYLDELLYQPKAEGFEIVGAVDPFPERSSLYEELKKRGIPVYASVEEFYEQHSAQLAIVVTPIHLHAKQSIYCMEHGSDVLCEKPLCAVPEEAERMMEARERTGRRLAVGYQWCHCEGILRLKQDVLNGVYGKIRRIRTIVLYPRDLAYYGRSYWPGKRQLPTGEWVLDSVASNATAHYLQNMLFLTGSRMDRSARPASMEAEVYRANPIEMFDTCAMRMRTDNDVELVYLVSHAVPMDALRQAQFVLEGELGTAAVSYEGEKQSLTGTLKDGTVIEYKAPDAEPVRKLYAMQEAILEDKPLPCVPETAMAHVECIYRLAESFPETPVFPEEYIEFNEEARQYTCRDLEKQLDQCWQDGKLPSEEGFGWAYRPHEIVFGTEEA